MKRLLQLGTFMLVLAALVTPGIEFFDQWDPPGPDSDTDFLAAYSYPLSLLQAQMAHEDFVMGDGSNAIVAQDGGDSASLPEDPKPQVESDAVSLLNTPIHILKHQGAIWTSPVQLKTRNLKWWLPLAAATGASLATDHYTMQSVVTRDTEFNQRSVNASNVLTGGFIAAPVALYGFGYLRRNEHSREAGLFGGEAILDGLVVEQGLKLITWRERPAQDNAHGLFFKGVLERTPRFHPATAFSLGRLHPLLPANIHHAGCRQAFIHSQPE